MPRLATTIPAIRKTNKNGVAEFFGVSLPLVDAWIRKDIPAVQRGRKGAPWVFDLREVAEWLYSGKTAASDPDGEANPELLDPADRKAWYEGERLKRELAERAEELITAEQYVEKQAELFKDIANSLEVLPDVLERRCNLAPEVVVLIRDMLDAHRAEVVDRIKPNGGGDSV